MIVNAMMTIWISRKSRNKFRQNIKIIGHNFTSLLYNSS